MHDILSDAFIEFGQILRDPGQEPLATFFNWATNTFDRFVAADAQGQRIISPRTLIVRWSFVSSQIMRDLTLRSRGEFGSFRAFRPFFSFYCEIPLNWRDIEIVHLFFEELLGLHCLRKVALQVSAVNASVEQSASCDMGYLALSPLPLHHLGGALVGDFDGGAGTTFSPNNTASYNPPLLSFSSSTANVVTPHASDFRRPLPNANDFLAPATSSGGVGGGGRLHSGTTTEFDHPFLSLAPSAHSGFPGSPNSHTMNEP
jgi:hypothetical protein